MFSISLNTFKDVYLNSSEPELKDKVEKTHPGRAAKREKKRNKQLKHNLNNIKHNNISIIGTPEGKESEQGIKDLYEEIMTKIFPNLVKGKYTQVQEAQRVPNELEPKRPRPRHIIIKMARLKDKETI